MQKHFVSEEERLHTKASTWNKALWVLKVPGWTHPVFCCFRPRGLPARISHPRKSVGEGRGKGS